VRIVGLSDAPIPWPIGQTRQGPRALVVFGALEKAVRAGKLEVFIDRE